MPEPEKKPEQIVTVLMSGELAEQLEEWSPPVQVKIIKTPGIGTGYEAIARVAEVPAVPVAGYRVRMFHADGSPNWQPFRPEDVEIIRSEAATLDT